MTPFDISECLNGGCHIGDVAGRTAYTPEERLLLAVVLQAVLDALEPTEEGKAARAFLQDPDVQSLTQVLWGVRTSGLFDRRQAARAINAYRTSQGKRLQYQKRRQ